MGPHLVLPSMALLWGITTVIQGLVTTYSSLLACRFFLGLFEGDFGTSSHRILLRVSFRWTLAWYYVVCVNVLSAASVAVTVGPSLNIIRRRNILTYIDKIFTH